MPHLHEFSDGPDTIDGYGYGFYAVGPIHLVPTTIMLAFRGYCRRKLGRWWLKSSQASTEKELAELQGTCGHRGDLREVEGVITAGSDLNAIVVESHDDNYALLHMAVLNGHLDAVQRLLLTGKVDINQRTLALGRTALMIAAERGDLGNSLHLRGKRPRREK